MKNFVSFIIIILFLSVFACQHTTNTKYEGAGASGISYPVGTPAKTDTTLSIKDPAGTWAINQFTIASINELVEEVNPVKVSGVPGLFYLFEENGTDENGTGFRGPDNATVNTLYQFPDGLPTLGQIWAFGTPAVESIGGTDYTVIPVSFANQSGGTLEITEQSSDPLFSSMSTGDLIVSTASGDMFYKSSTGGYQFTGTYTLDPVIPVVSGVTIDGTGLIISYDVAVTQGTGYNDNLLNIDGSTMGTDVAITYASGDGTTTHTYTAATAAVDGETVTLDFLGGIDALESSTGGDLAAFTGQSVTNNTSGATPLVAVGTYTGNGVDDRGITGIGFQPEVVFIQGDGSGSGAWRTPSHVGDLSSDWTVEEIAAANKIQSLDADGFTVGTDADVNTNTTVYYYIALADNGSGAIAYGTYAGNDVDGRNITGVGFQPDAVILKTDGLSRTIWKTSDMTGANSTGFLGALSYSTVRLLSLDADGFTVGDSIYVNTSGSNYYWVALQNTTNKINVNTYVGNAVDDRAITGVGFQPDAVISKEGSGTSVGVIRTVDMAGEGSLTGDGSIADNRIQSLDVDGFTIGTSSFINESGLDYFSISIKE